MTKLTAVNQLEAIIGKLSHLNYQVEGNQLQTAIREIASVRDRLSADRLKIRKLDRKKSVRSK